MCAFLLLYACERILQHQRVRCTPLPATAAISNALVLLIGDVEYTAITINTRLSEVPPLKSIVQATTQGTYILLPSTI